MAMPRSISFCLIQGLTSCNALSTRPYLGSVHATSIIIGANQWKWLHKTLFKLLWICFKNIIQKSDKEIPVGLKKYD